MHKGDYIFHCISAPTVVVVVGLFIFSSFCLSRLAYYRFVSNIIMTLVRAASLINGYERTITDGRVFALARVSRNEPVKKTEHQ